MMPETPDPSTEMELWERQVLASATYRRLSITLRVQRHLVDIFRWPRWPLLSVVWVFWTSVMDEGIVSTCKPRWGALTFAYLNDGNKPSLWHTWHQMTHGQDDPYTGLYVDKEGAPRSLAEAQEWERKWATKRFAHEYD